MDEGRVRGAPSSTHRHGLAADTKDHEKENPRKEEEKTKNKKGKISHGRQIAHSNRNKTALALPWPWSMTLKPKLPNSLYYLSLDTTASKCP
jgi:hypothetical protein